MYLDKFNGHGYGHRKTLTCLQDFLFTGTPDSVNIPNWLIYLSEYIIFTVILGMFLIDNIEVFHSMSLLRHWFLNYKLIIT